MALKSSTKLWLLAIFWLIFIVAVADWLEHRSKSKNKTLKKQTTAYELDQ